MIRGVLFDMDGVLVDNTAAHVRAFMEFAARHSITITSEQFIPLFGRGNEEIFPAIMDRGLIDRYGIDALADEKERIYRETYASEIHPMTGLLTFLADLSAHGILCAVGSSARLNGMHSIRRVSLPRLPKSSRISGLGEHAAAESMSRIAGRRFRFFMNVDVGLWVRISD